MSTCRAGAPGCVLEDDLTPVLEDISAAGAVALSSPNYYGYASGIFKSFLDRFYGFRDGQRILRLPPDRPLMMIFSQGHPDPDAYEPLIQSMDKILSAYGFIPKMLVAAGMEAPGAAAGSAELVGRARELGRTLCGG